MRKSERCVGTFWPGDASVLSESGHIVSALSVLLEASK